MSAPDPGGAITITLGVREGRVTEVNLHSTRRPDAARVLAGMTLEKALGSIPMLFTVCAAAHTSAALAAAESASGQPTSPATARARRLSCLLEAIESYAFQVCVEWPPLAGGAPLLDPLRRARRATGALRRWFGGPAAASGSVEPLVVELRAAAEALAPAAALEDEPALFAWASAADAPIAGLLHAVLASGAAGFGRAGSPLLGQRPVAWFAARLRDPEFSASPTLDGSPAETGAIARAADHPAVARCLEDHGRGLLARLIARVADARASVDMAEQLAREQRAGAVVDAVPKRVSGSGTGVVDTARGPLAHAIELTEGRVVAWRTVAPTEWTFHPEGVVREALLGAPAEDLVRRARWLIAALDPCVPCAVRVHERTP